ncbi:hypothetical protein M422DRAFT_778806 [Sphaerobolus stellatus SS14]|uniref:Uncharacterized protein n=1 Tax=Sphaerobolus stellatus (strain SS14) TaxID=990650 RepID=A0A0C9URU6_SPHS4|nr:hypothetical protein M422DRAFT_778806 [Sphaerobolus stellatus SS14]
MRKFNLASAPLFASVFTAFVAGVLDVGQVLIRGRAATDADTEISVVLPYLIGREVMLSLSIGFRYLFFLFFVSLPPQGEPPTPPKQPENPTNFLHIDNEAHSGAWMRWGFAGFVLKYILLSGVIAVTVLQHLWRLDSRFSNTGGVYKTDSILEVVMTGLFITKLFANASISKLRPKWKIIGNYLPVLFALMFSLTIAVGDVIQFQFSESSLGRFLQGIELYILVLFILISSFYSQRQRFSMLLTSKGTDPSGEKSPMSSEQELKSPTSLNTFISQEAILPSPSFSKRANRMSSWIITADLPVPADPAPRRTSRARRLSSWLMGKSPVQEDYTQPDVESGSSPVDQTTGFAIPSDIYTPAQEITPVFNPARRSQGIPTPTGRFERLAAELNLGSPKNGEDARSPTRSPPQTSAGASSPRRLGDSTTPPMIGLPAAPNASIIYGANGILNYYNAPGSDTNSARSSGIASLLRQQAELDRSVAELQMFSPNIRDSTVQDPSIISKNIESFRSDFSLSNFPRPPSEAVTNYDERTDSGDRTISRDVSSLKDFSKLPPLLKGSNDFRFSGRPLSFPSALRFSRDSSLLGAERTFINSNGTQYDVTSFIGGAIPDLTIPIAAGNTQSQPQSQAQPEQERGILTPPREADERDSLPAAQINYATLVPVPPRIAVTPADRNMVRNGSARTRQGLPSTVKLKISNPIQTISVDGMEGASAYERPRPVPPA